MKIIWDSKVRFTVLFGFWNLKRILRVSRKKKDWWLSSMDKAFFPKNLIKALDSGSSSWKEMDYLLVSFEIMSDWME